MTSKDTTTTLRLTEEMLLEARKYDINISKAARDGIQRAIDREKKIRDILDE